MCSMFYKQLIQYEHLFINTVYCQLSSLQIIYAQFYFVFTVHLSINIHSFNQRMHL
jgi:hypothetical protein